MTDTPPARVVRSTRAVTFHPFHLSAAGNPARLFGGSTP